MNILQYASLDIQSSKLILGQLFNLLFIILRLIYCGSLLGKNSQSVSDKQLRTSTDHFDNQELLSVIQGGFRAYLTNVTHTETTCMHQPLEGLRIQWIFIYTVQIFDQLRYYLITHA